jgi:hypothetical protein
MKRHLLASIFLFATFGARAEKLSEALQLPDYISKHYGELELSVREGGRQAQATMLSQTRLKSVGGGHGAQSAGIERVASGLSVTIPAGLSPGDKREALARALFDVLAKQDRQFRYALEDLENMGSFDPEKGSSSLNMRDKVREVFAAKLAGSKAPKDPMAELWWKLKFEAEDTSSHAEKIRPGDPMLMVLHQRGYRPDPKDMNLIQKLQSRIDFGHSVIGIRYAGQGPEKDLLLNPGSKNREFYEADLPMNADPRFLNMVDTDNLWKWTQTQIGKRYMKVSAEILPLTKTQKEALPQIIPKMRGLNFGPAVGFTNNCADGAGAIVNFLMPIERSFSPQSMLGPSLPGIVKAKSARRFQDSRPFEFSNIASQNPKNFSPGVAYKDQKFERRELTTFDDFRAFEKSFLESQN